MFKITAEEKALILKRRKVQGYNPIEEVNPGEDFEGTDVKNLSLTLRRIVETHLIKDVISIKNNVAFGNPSQTYLRIAAELIDFSRYFLGLAVRPRKSYAKSLVKDLISLLKDATL